MMNHPELLVAIPVLASFDIERTVNFYSQHLGFTSLYVMPGEYAVLARDAIDLHFLASSDAQAAAAMSCRIRVSHIATLYAQCNAAGIIDQDWHLATRPWGAQEFSVRDPDQNRITFTQPAVPSDAQSSLALDYWDEVLA